MQSNFISAPHESATGLPVRKVQTKFRFSLSVFVSFILLVGSSATLWWRWEPWGLEQSDPHPWPDGDCQLSNGDAVDFAPLAIRGQNGQIVLENNADITQISHDKRLAAVLNSDQETIHIWNLYTRRQEHDFSKYAKYCMDISLSDDCSQLVIFENGVIHIFEIPSERETASWKATDDQNPIGLDTLVRFVQPSTLVTSVIQSDLKHTELKIWSVADGKLMWRHTEPRQVHALTVSPDKRYFVTYARASGPGEGIGVYSIGDRKLSFFIPSPNWSVRGFSQDSRLMATDEYPAGLVHLWSLDTGENAGNIKIQRWENSALDIRIASVEIESPERVRIHLNGNNCCMTQTYRLRRPESTYGILFLPESWLAIVFGCIFLKSVWRDRKDSRSQTQ